MDGSFVMTTTLGSLSNAFAYSSSVGTTDSMAIAHVADPELAQTAVGLSTNAGVVATLGGAAPTVQVYDAAGLLNTLAQAGSAPPTSLPVPSAGTDVPNLTQQIVEQGVVGSLATDAAASGIYTSTGTVQSLPTDTSANWATVLKSNADLSATVIADSYAQGIIGTLSLEA